MIYACLHVQGSCMAQESPYMSWLQKCCCARQTEEPLQQSPLPGACNTLREAFKWPMALCSFTWRDQASYDKPAIGGNIASAS